MREVPEFAEARAAWVNQPEEEIPVDVTRMHRQRTWELFSTTRSEIFSSIIAALFFASVMAWRFGVDRDGIVQMGCIGMIVWAGVTVLRYRRAIRSNEPQADALASTGLEHYRTELLRRRDHLRSAWIWHGPMLLACVVASVILGKRMVPGRLWDALPVIVLLAGWAAIGIKRRLRQAAELQREIDEMAGVS